jgi:hypothetical protein
MLCRGDAAINVRLVDALRGGLFVVATNHSNIPPALWAHLQPVRLRRVRYPLIVMQRGQSILLMMMVFDILLTHFYFARRHSSL